MCDLADLQCLFRSGCRSVHELQGTDSEPPKGLIVHLTISTSKPLHSQEIRLNPLPKELKLPGHQTLLYSNPRHWRLIRQSSHRCQPPPPLDRLLTQPVPRASARPSPPPSTLVEYVIDSSMPVLVTELWWTIATPAVAISC